MRQTGAFLFLQVDETNNFIDSQTKEKILKRITFLIRHSTKGCNLLQIIIIWLYIIFIQQIKGVEKMKNQNAQNATYSAEKFQNAEQLWFWFLYSKSVQNGFARNRGISSRRACELLDVETLITKLYLSGQLTDEQLNVMKKFGDKRRAPHQYIWAENRAADLWRRAMDTLNAAAIERGWIE